VEQRAARVVAEAPGRRIASLTAPSWITIAGSRVVDGEATIGKYAIDVGARGRR